MALPFVSPPRASVEILTRAMTRVYSPASAAAPALYQIPIRYGLDPAVAWAFAEHEHHFFTQGVAVRSKNWGNLRKSQGNAYQTIGGFAYYRTFEAGLEDWCRLIAYAYIPQGFDTVEAALPRYAPLSDGNAPAAYIAAVRRRVTEWQLASGLADPWAAWGAAHPLPEDQRGFAIPQAWLSAGSLGAAISDEVPTPWGAFRFFERGAVVWYRSGNETKVYR